MGSNPIYALSGEILPYIQRGASLLWPLSYEVNGLRPKFHATAYVALFEVETVNVGAQGNKWGQITIFQLASRIGITSLGCYIALQVQYNGIDHEVGNYPSPSGYA